MHVFTLESIRASSKWWRQNSSRSEEVNLQASGGKVLLTVFIKE
jgi:hypothetical protein